MRLTRLPPSLSPAPPERGFLARSMRLEGLLGDSRGRRRVAPPLIAWRPSPCAVTIAVGVDNIQGETEETDPPLEVQSI